MGADCVFCKITAKELPAYTIYENGHYMAILDINPAAYGHVLIIPKEHFAGLSDVPDAFAREFLTFTREVARAVMDVSGAEGFNLVQNDGAAAGQTVMHFHAHIVPRRAGDGLSFSWIPKTPSREFMAEMAVKLADRLSGA